MTKRREKLKGSDMYQYIKLDALIDFERDVDSDLQTEFVDKFIDLVESYKAVCFCSWKVLSEE